MNPITATLMLLGAGLSLLSGIGLLRFSTPYARFHAAGKASPIAFVVVAVGAMFEVGTAGAARLVLASAAMLLTLPVGVHLLFRAVHRTTPDEHLRIDELAPAEQESGPPDPPAAPSTDDQGGGGLDDR